MRRPCLSVSGFSARLKVQVQWLTHRPTLSLISSSNAFQSGNVEASAVPMKNKSKNARTPSRVILLAAFCMLKISALWRRFASVCRTQNENKPNPALNADAPRERRLALR